MPPGAKSEETAKGEVGAARRDGRAAEGGGLLNSYRLLKKSSQASFEHESHDRRYLSGHVMTIIGDKMRDKVSRAPF
jgi:hypothetical protein